MVDGMDDNKILTEFGISLALSLAGNRLLGLLVNHS
jgi:hypothetical protein